MLIVAANLYMLRPEHASLSAHACDEKASGQYDMRIDIYNRMVTTVTSMSAVESPLLRDVRDDSDGTARLSEIAQGPTVLFWSSRKAPQ